MARKVKPEVLEKYNKAISLLSKGYNAKTAADEVGVKMASLLRHIRVNGIPYNKPSTNIHPQFHEEIKHKYISGSSSNVLAKQYDVGNDAILRFLRNSGIAIVKPTDTKFYKQGYTINRDAFKDLDSEETAYFYGWLLTDGNMSDNGRVSLEVQRIDEDIILNLQKYLNLSRDVFRRSRYDVRTNNTYHSTETYFSDAVINESLYVLGMTPRKSMKEVCPEVFQYNRHFWRGVLEGDGWIGKSRYDCGVVGSKELVESFKKYCLSIGISKVFVGEHQGELYISRISNLTEASLLLKELYRDTDLFLKRKYSLFKERYNVH